ncbi:carboxypeptidase N subunit 2-like [Contarinia nasturtii]|uniref:carboxypeptidase N subunit 2-like n=1 Tax=Contarinia nasturtii TaxID=265458 RepID=UPI0012D40DB4|nr:carboxypeptidase N subunit 2-like [Contarinia nasturtii]
MYQLLSIVIGFVIISQIRGDICDFCNCTPNVCDPTKNSSDMACVIPEEFFACNKNRDDQAIDLYSIRWPNRNITVSVKFNDFKLTYLNNLLCSTLKPSITPTLVEINLEKNVIEHITGNPFQYCNNLTSISIANNLIDGLPSELFESTHLLQRLNISHNKLSEFDGVILSRCKHIIELDLSHNEITILKVNEILDASPRIQKLYAENNALFSITDSNQNKYLELKSLYLSSNKMMLITSNTFASYPLLNYINVSSNILGNIEPNAFQELDELRTLDLSSNNLKDVLLKLPDSIEHISLAKNQLKYWPMAIHPKNLQKLELQENELIEIFNTATASKNRIKFLSLKYFNVSKNHINSLPSSLHYPALEVFDASYNSFESIPQYLGSQIPNLKELRFRGNAIKTIEFTTKLSADIIDLSELPTLTEFDANVFNSIAPKSDCVQLIISHSPLLRKIRNSFERVPKLCGLDLSYNNLKFIDHNWMNWSALDHGANLQGNPIECNCNMQWLVDFFVPLLYVNQENHHYLYELRCSSPARFSHHRLVSFLNHSEPFCKPDKTIYERSRFYSHLYSEQVDEYELLWYKGFGLWLIVALNVIIISSSVAILFILIRRWKRHRTNIRNNRRFQNGGVL